MSVPIVIISFNNHEFVENTIVQLKRFGLDSQDMIVIDNASDWNETQEFLNHLRCRVVRNSENLGHLCWARPEIFDTLPDKFCVTDPDLQFHPNLPSNFIEVMSTMADRLSACKVGFALDISDSEEMFQYEDYHLGQSILQWESKFWKRRVAYEALEVYLAEVDTTFHLFNKRGRPQCQIRIAGEYTAKHLPWYRTNALIPPHRMTEVYKNASRVSNVARFHMRQHEGFSDALAHVATARANADESAQTLTVTTPDAPELKMMGQTPAHTAVNSDVLAMIPSSARCIVEVGCMQGALAAAHRAKNPDVQYIGIDIDADYAAVAAKHCTQAMAANIETMDDAAFASLFPSDCWIFADCLEHLRDPWRVLLRVRRQIAPDGTLLVCLPNAQHWSQQWRLASGQFRYEDSGLMDRTHLRWFTRITMLEMFENTGWRVQQGLSRILNAPQQPQMLSAVRSFATSMGLDAEVAAQDATAFQYVFKLVPN